LRSRNANADRARASGDVVGGDGDGSYNADNSDFTQTSSA
jgi:hypothetical protein